MNQTTSHPCSSRRGATIGGVAAVQAVPAGTRRGPFGTRSGPSRRHVGRREGAVLALALIALGAGAARAATYYVSPNGSDGGPGSQAQPFQTLQRAADIATS